MLNVYFLGTSTWEQLTGTCTGPLESKYSTLDEAKKQCETSPVCMGIEKECGKEESYGICTTSVASSLCGSIFYKRIGKLIPSSLIFLLSPKLNR